MKKVMIFAAGFAAAAAFADVTSANTVGYVTATSRAGSAQFGNMFVSPGGSGSWQLSQVTPGGCRDGVDYIQFLSTDNATVYLFAVFYDRELNGADGGWWNRQDDSISLDDAQFSAGTPFLCAFSDSNTINWTFSGQVIGTNAAGKVELDVHGQGSPYVCNPLPRTVTLGEVDAVGFRDGVDYIQFLSTDNASAYLFAVYYDRELNGADGGWWNRQDDSISLDDQALAPGEAVLGAVDAVAAPNVKFVFPSPYSTPAP